MIRLRKHQHSPATGHKPASGSVEVLVRLGKADFVRGDYEGAIVQWEQAQRRADVKPELLAVLDTALAEAHFRLALSDGFPDLEHLEQAARLAPHDHRFRYHLARAYYMHNKVELAIDTYRQLLAEQPPCRRAALPLALTLLSLGQDLKADPVWEHLTRDEQQRMRWTEALLEKRADWVRRNAPVQGADACWGGLARVALSDAEAWPVLEAALTDSALPPFTGAVLRYYRGVLLARQDEPTPRAKGGADPLSQALTEWRAARQMDLATPWLYQNLSAVYQRRLSDLLQDVDQEPPGAPLSIDRLREGYALVEEGLQLVPDEAVLMRAKYLILWHLGHAEAMAGRWATALSHWQAAYDCNLGYDRSLMINLALAYEKNERYAEAAELWRSVIRRRPRRSDVPYALNEAQIARVWQHVAESYRKAGNFAEAIQTYRNAIKWAPHNVELQLGLVEVLMADDRPVAASTVVQQVLQTHPDHVEALAWQAEIYEVQGWLQPALATWERVLQLEPQHARARPHLARLLELEGDSLRRRHWYEQAVEVYQRGLEYWPQNARMRALLGLCHARLRQLEVARQLFEEALRLGEPDKVAAHYWVICAWLELGRWGEALAVLDQAEKLEPPPPSTLYLDLSAHCLAMRRPDWAMALWERALARFPNDPDFLIRVAIGYGRQGDGQRATHLLRRAIELEPNNELAHLWLANHYYTELGQKRLAERHWRIAEELAHKAGNREMVTFIRVTRDYFISGRRTLPPELIMDALGGIADQARGLDGSNEENKGDNVPDPF